MLPKETILALFPEQPRRFPIGLFSHITIGAITLEQAAVMEMFECGLTKGYLNRKESLIAIWILSRSRNKLHKLVNGEGLNCGRFIRKIQRQASRVERLVNTLIDEALSTFVPAKSISGATVNQSLKGYGWPLEIAEAISANYSVTLDDALCMPVQRAFAMISVQRSRLGGESGGPDYFERIYINRLREIGLVK